MTSSFDKMFKDYYGRHRKFRMKSKRLKKKLRKYPLRYRSALHVGMDTPNPFISMLKQNRMEFKGSTFHQPIKYTRHCFSEGWNIKETE